LRLVDVPLDDIEVGGRRRTDFGDIGALAKGMQLVGLLEPIVVDRNGCNDCYRLVAGERRLRAARMLKWKTIPASLLEHLTEAERREIELEENENRKSLTEHERTRTFASSKRLVENARKAKEVLAQSAQKPNQKGTKGGRPKEPDSPQAVADVLGTDRRTLERAERHFEMAEWYPWMQGNRWRQSDVLRMRERLEELPSDQAREQTMGILGAARILDPALVVELIENIAAKKPAEREEIYRLSQSDDSRERSLALTRAAHRALMADPRLSQIPVANRIRQPGGVSLNSLPVACRRGWISSGMPLRPVRLGVPVPVGFHVLDDSLLGAQHLLEMFRRTLPSGPTRSGLGRLSNRLTKICSETKKLKAL
jgi:ParB family chromosome partitioning protein